MLKRIYTELVAMIQAKRNDSERGCSVEVSDSDGSCLVIEDIQHLPAGRAKAADVSVV